MVDEWTREKPLTTSELATYRELKRQHLLEVYGHTLEGCTCDECSRAPICHLAFDGYNTNGDCLYEK